MDLRWAKDEDQLDLQDPRFADAVADIGSALRGVPKDELASEEVRQHRHTVRTASVGGVALATLAVLAAVLAVQSSNNAAEAERQAQTAEDNAAEAEANALRADANAAAESEEREQADASAAEARRNATLAQAREWAASASAVMERGAELATLLALHATYAAQDVGEIPPEVSDALWEAKSANRLLQTIEFDYPVERDGGSGFLSVSPDGGLLLMSGLEDVVLHDLAAGMGRWHWSLDQAGTVGVPTISPDGSLVAVPVANPIPEFNAEIEPDIDAAPASGVVLDGVSGTERLTLEFPDCLQMQYAAFSPDGAWLVVSHGNWPCSRDGAPSDAWVEVYDTETWSPVRLIDAPGLAPWGPLPEFDESGQLFLFGIRNIEVRAADSFDPVIRLDETFGLGSVNSDGTPRPLGERGHVRHPDL